MLSILYRLFFDEYFAMLGCCESEFAHSLDLTKINRQMSMLPMFLLDLLDQLYGCILLVTFFFDSVFYPDELLILLYNLLIIATCRTSFHPICAREAGNRLEIWGKHGCDTVSFIPYRTKSLTLVMFIL